MNDKGVCITAPATPGLLMRTDYAKMSGKISASRTYFNCLLVLDPVLPIQWSKGPVLWYQDSPYQKTAPQFASESQEDNQSPIPSFSSEPFTDLSLSQTHKEGKTDPHKTPLFSKQPLTFTLPLASLTWRLPKINYYILEPFKQTCVVSLCC